MTVDSRDDSILYPVNNLYATIQGEGVQTGIPMVLLRLQGCDIGCPFCDTKETWEMDPAEQRDRLEEALGANRRFVFLSPARITESVRSVARRIRWVLITGGEPARFDLRPLLSSLREAGFRSAVETSGTYPLFGNPDWLCVSPKYKMPEKRHLEPNVLSLAHELKFLVGKKSDLRLIDLILKQYETRSDVQVCLQPISLSRSATRICLDAVIQRGGWRLSLQSHHFAGID